MIDMINDLIPWLIIGKWGLGGWGTTKDLTQILFGFIITTKGEMFSCAN